MISNSEGVLVKGSSITIGVIATVAVILRLLARWKCKAGIGADDIIIVASLIPQYAMIIIGCLLVSQTGLGLPVEDVRPTQLPLFLKYIKAGIITYSVTITLVKAGILVLYCRIFATATFRKKAFIVGAACLVWFMIVEILNLAQCRPFSAAFAPELVFSDRCINFKAYFWGLVASNLALDLVVLYLPIHEVWKLQLPTRQKIMLSGIFLLGSLVCVSSAMRLGSIAMWQTDNITRTIVPDYIWSQVEPGAAIVCACIVTMKPLFANVKLPFPSSSSLFRRSKITKSRDSSSMDVCLSREVRTSWSESHSVGKSDAYPFQTLNENTTKEDFYVVNINSPRTLA